MAGTRTTTPPVRVRAGTPSALLAIVPHLLGFAPEASIVIEAGKGTVKVTLRYDLPSPPDQELADDIAGSAVAVLAAQPLTTAVAVGYGEDELVRPVSEALRNVMERAGISLAECLRTDHGRYWSHTCTDQARCSSGAVPTRRTLHPRASGEADLHRRLCWTIFGHLSAGGCARSGLLGLHGARGARPQGRA